MKRIFIPIMLVLTVLFTLTQPASAQNPEPVIQVSFYWMAGCPHCEEVIQKVLPPLQQSYGDSLQLEMIELVSLQDVDNFYALAASWGLTKEKTGVPLAIIAGQVLVGKDEIAARLPVLVADAFTAGGSSALATQSVPAAASAGEGLCLPETPCTTSGPDAKTIGLLALGLVALLAGGWVILRRVRPV